MMGWSDSTSNSTQMFLKLEKLNSKHFTPAQPNKKCSI